MNCFNINRFSTFLLFHTQHCVLCSSRTFVVGKRKFVSFKPKLMVYVKLLIVAEVFSYIVTANGEHFPSSSPSPISYLDMPLRGGEKKKKLAHVVFAVFPYVTVHITATQLGAGCNLAPGNWGSRAHVFLLRTGGIQRTHNYNFCHWRKQYNLVIIKNKQKSGIRNTRVNQSLKI